MAWLWRNDVGAAIVIVLGALCTTRAVSWLASGITSQFNPLVQYEVECILPGYVPETLGVAYGDPDFDYGRVRDVRP